MRAAAAFLCWMRCIGEQTVYIAAQWGGNKIALRRAKLSQKWCSCGILLPSADAD